jgi:hypothetical protein
VLCFLHCLILLVREFLRIRRFFLFLIFIKEFTGIRSQVLYLLETLHPFEFIESHVTELVDPDLEPRRNRIMRVHQVQVRLEYREASAVLLLRQVVTVVPCDEILKGLKFILREADILEEACLGRGGRRLGAEEGRNGCHCAHEGQDG